MRLFQTPSTILKCLQDNQITDTDHFHYLLGYVILQSFVGCQSLFPALATLASNPLYALIQIASIAIALAEIRTCFRINQRGDNHHFLSRFICLGFSVSLRYYIAYFLLYLVFLKLIELLPLLAPILTCIIILMPIAVSVLSYRKMRSLFLVFS